MNVSDLLAPEVDKLDNDTCLELIFRFYYGDEITCWRCGNKKFNRVKGRPCFACTICRYQISPLAGTIFARTRVPLVAWFYVIYKALENLESQSPTRINITHLSQEICTGRREVRKMIRLVEKFVEELNMYAQVEDMAYFDLVTVNYAKDKPKTWPNMDGITLTDEGKRALGRV